MDKNKEFTFTVTQQELWDALAKARQEHFKHLSNGCSYGQADGLDDFNKECDCPEEDNG